VTDPNTRREARQLAGARLDVPTTAGCSRRAQATASVVAPRTLAVDDERQPASDTEAEAVPPPCARRMVDARRVVETDLETVRAVLGARGRDDLETMLVATTPDVVIDASRRLFDRKERRRIEDARAAGEPIYEAYSDSRTGKQYRRQARGLSRASINEAAPLDRLRPRRPGLARRARVARSGRSSSSTSRLRWSAPLAAWRISIAG
jgi:hypothetical protein